LHLPPDKLNPGIDKVNRFVKVEQSVPIFFPLQRYVFIRNFQKPKRNIRICNHECSEDKSRNMVYCY
ncbi:MAG: hypothetical protein LBT42_03250, partial [Tannerella sp.]|nr:hypothetical protein [Tannerella sp.]